MMGPMFAALRFFVSSCVWLPTLVDARAFLSDFASARHLAGAQQFRRELRESLNSGLGCVRDARDAAQQLERRLATREALLPTWNVLPKNANGNIERRTLRYLAHRYFMGRYAITVRGFEPSIPENQSDWGAADSLSRGLPDFLLATLEAHSASRHDFGLTEATYMIMMLERIVEDSDGALLEHVYADYNRSVHSPLSYKALKGAMEAYVLHWLLDADDDMLQHLLDNRSLLLQVPLWSAFARFADGVIQNYIFERRKLGSRSRVGPGDRRTGGALSMWYSFDDAHEVVNRLTRSFSSWWRSMCATTRAHLVSLDQRGSGRVPLGKFYATALQNVDHWHNFTESEAYLREMGALDDSSSVRGKEVIIPNYLHAASNCIVSTSHYRICCPDECEAILGEIETTIGASTATPELVMGVVENVSNLMELDDEEPRIPKVLIQHRQFKVDLETMAAANNGRVQLHGRLFAQWLHFRFPRHCAFPHKAGTVSHVTASEFAAPAEASEEEMLKEMYNPFHLFIEEELSDVSREGFDWRSQWSDDEEFFADYGAPDHATLPEPAAGSASALQQLLSGIAAVSFALLTVAALWSRVYAAWGLPWRRKSVGASTSVGKLLV